MWYVPQMLERCRGLVLQLSHVPCKGREQHLKESVMRSLMISLTEANSSYSTSCAAYTHATTGLRQTSVAQVADLEEQDDHLLDTGLVSPLVNCHNIGNLLSSNS